MKSVAALIAITIAGISLPADCHAATIKAVRGDCAKAQDTHLCEAQSKQFAEDWKAANRGEYSGQRNAAFCLKNGCDGAVKTNPIAGCAWRMIIQAADNEKDEADRWSYESDCQTLTNGDRRKALDSAEASFLRIYKKEMPLDGLLRR